MARTRRDCVAEARKNKRSSFMHGHIKKGNMKRGSNNNTNAMPTRKRGKRRCRLTTRRFSKHSIRAVKKALRVPKKGGSELEKGIQEKIQEKYYLITAIRKDGVKGSDKEHQHIREMFKSAREFDKDNITSLIHRAQALIKIHTLITELDEKYRDSFCQKAFKDVLYNPPVVIDLNYLSKQIENAAWRAKVLIQFEMNEKEHNVRLENSDDPENQKFIKNYEKQNEQCRYLEQIREQYHQEPTEEEARQIAEKEAENQLYVFVNNGIKPASSEPILLRKGETLTVGRHTDNNIQFDSPSISGKLATITLDYTGCITLEKTSKADANGKPKISKTRLYDDWLGDISKNKTHIITPGMLLYIDAPKNFFFNFNGREPVSRQLLKSILVDTANKKFYNERIRSRKTATRIDPFADER